MAYALIAQEKQYPLQTGKNVVGRSSVPVEGVSFINLESPLAAISRMQAFLDVAANGDAWISDCNSTNGTFLSIRPGPGIRLEANRYYQLTPGSRIVFGDVECTFQLLGSTPDLLEQDATTAPGRASSRKTERLSVIGASTDSTEKAAESRQEAKLKPARGTAHRSNVPYLDESVGSSQEQSSVPPPLAEKGVSKRSSSASSPSPSSLKKAKTDTASKSSSSPTRTNKTSKAMAQTADSAAAPPVVCLTGMDSDERAAVTKRVRLLKGRVVENITKANLLVVAIPPVRTPKFVIAVARGIPVVSVKYICNDAAELADPRGNIVGLKTDQHTYSAAALEKVIYRKENRPLLQGVRINITALSSKTKSVATEIITASGGEAVRSTKGATLSVADDDLDALYDSILRGKVPKSL